MNCVQLLRSVLLIDFCRKDKNQSNNFIKLLSQWCTHFMYFFIIIIFL